MLASSLCINRVFQRFTNTWFSAFHLMKSFQIGSVSWSFFVGNEENLKTGVAKKQSTPNFPKNEHFLPSDTYTGKKCSFFGKFGELCFLVTSVLRFALLPHYRRIVQYMDCMRRFIQENSDQEKNQHWHTFHTFT